MAMIPTSFTLLLFLLPLVFVMKISHKDQVMNNLNTINAESLPLLMGLKSMINDLPENKLTGVISTLDELIQHAEGQEQNFVNIMTNYEGLLRANETAYNASVIAFSIAEDARILAEQNAYTCTTTAATARAAKTEALRLKNIAETDYQNSVTNHANEDLNSTITTLQYVRGMIFGLLQDQSASPTANPTASPTTSPTTTVHYHSVFADKFCSTSNDWDTSYLSGLLPDLEWYVHYGNGVCNIGDNGGPQACANICGNIPECQYFSTSTTRPCYACFVYKSCEQPIATTDYQIYAMGTGTD